MTVLDSSLHLSLERQSPLIAKLQRAEFRGSDMASCLVGGGLWIAYAVFALVWFHSMAAADLNEADNERVIVPMVASLELRGLERFLAHVLN